MRYCYNCNRITRGEPIFCSFCGRTYNQKFCSRMHPNPRRGQFCSQCGSAEFSTPQPVIPILLRPAFWFLKLSPKLVIPATLVILIAFILHPLVTDPYVQVANTLTNLSPTTSLGGQHRASKIRASPNDTQEQIAWYYEQCENPVGRLGPRLGEACRTPQACRSSRACGAD
jgi:hypothetical protein